MSYTLVPSELIVDGAITSAKLDTNISISGTLGVTGEVTLATHLNMGDNDKIKIGTGGDLEIYHDGSNSYIANSTGNIYIADTNGAVHIQAKLNEESIVATADGAVTLYHDNSAKLATASGGVTVTGTLTPSGVLTANAGVVVDNITIDGTEIDLSSGDLTLDVAGDIILDADGGDIKFFDGSTEFADHFKDGNDYKIQTTISNGDFVIVGNDNGSAINALTLDMSDAGAATFNSTINGLTLAAGSIATSTSQNFALNTPNSLRINIDSNNSATDQIFVIGHNQTAVDNNNSLFTILESGNVGIGESNPNSGLHIAEGGSGSDGGSVLTLSQTGFGSIVNNDDLGSVHFGGKTSGGVGVHNSAKIMVEGDGTWANNDYPSRITFHTTTDGAASSTERMRIDSSGIITKPYQPAFHAFGPTSATSDADVIFQNVYVNTGSHYSTSNGRFTAPVAGVYIFFWSAIGNNNNDVYRYFLHKNGSNAIANSGNDIQLRIDTLATGSEYGTNGSRVQMLALAANDYIQIHFESDSGNSTYVLSDYMNFGGFLIG